MVMQNAEPVSTRKYTERMVKITNSIYAKADLMKVINNATQLNAEERTQLLSLLKDFEELFGGTLGHWKTEPVYFDLKPDSKRFNNRYHLFPRINKEMFLM